MCSISALRSSIAAPPGRMRRPGCYLSFGGRHLRLLQHASLAEQVLDRDRWLRASFPPFHHPLLLERDGSGRLQWVVRAQEFDVPPVSRHPGIRRHNSKEGPLPTALSRESQSHHVCLLLFVFYGWYALLLERPRRPAEPLRAATPGQHF